jgi:hypothetical protein
VGPTFSLNLEALFNEGTATLNESEVKIFQMWKLVAKGFKPWEIDPDYEDNERIIKPEDKADLFKLDQFETNAARNRDKKQKGLADLKRGLGLGFGSQTEAKGKQDKIKEFLAKP